MKSVPFAESGLPFLGADAALPEAEIALYGMPMDWTVSWRPGTRFGPRAIRAASPVLETFSPYQSAALDDWRIADCGDLDLPFGNASRSLQIIEAAVGELVDAGKRPVGIGGEHLAAVGAVRALAARYPDLRLLHWDAHADLRETYAGEPLSHACALRRMSEVVDPQRIYSMGVRSATDQEWRWAEGHLHFFPFELLRPLQAIQEELSGYPVYLTFDIDVIDPGFCPGTGTPEPGGVVPQEAFEALAALADLHWVGFDLVEAAPSLDATGATAALAAKLLREGVIALGRALSRRPAYDRKEE
ncbi:MAG: agmatinase [Firmicutes bacterium]|nr:agmatinase [Bacillota bacterium]